MKKILFLISLFFSVGVFAYPTEVVIKLEVPKMNSEKKAKVHFVRLKKHLEFVLAGEKCKEVSNWSEVKLVKKRSKGEDYFQTAKTICPSDYTIFGRLDHKTRLKRNAQYQIIISDKNSGAIRSFNFRGKGETLESFSFKGYEGNEKFKLINISSVKNIDDHKNFMLSVIDNNGVGFARQKVLSFPLDGKMDSTKLTFKDPKEPGYMQRWRILKNADKNASAIVNKAVTYCVGIEGKVLPVPKKMKGEIPLPCLMEISPEGQIGNLTENIISRKMLVVLPDLDLSYMKNNAYQVESRKTFFFVYGKIH